MPSAPDSGEPCLYGLFAAQAERTPDRVAVSYEGAEVTYRELRDRARKLAAHLKRLGVGPETKVGIYAERSVEMVTGLFGTLAAGAAWVPLDPSYPAERLAWMVEDAGVPVLLAQEKLVPKLPPHRARVVPLEEGGDPKVPPEPLAGPRPEPLSDSLAYVIYTSGSTGRPKGVMNAHRAVCNRLFWMQDAFGLDGSDRVLQKTPFSFDVSVWEFLWPLLVGARLVMARPGGHQDPAYLVDVIAREEITTLHFVPSMLRAFLGAPGLERCTSLRRVVCSGEALPADLVRRFYSRLGTNGPELHNLYGPTEAAVDVTWWHCLPEGLGASVGSDRSVGSVGSVPIGRPISNTTIHILDAGLEPVPQGDEGELYIGGVQPARGYHGRPDLTAEKFVPDPFPSPAGIGARLYRTGDLARFRPDGAIDFLGRIDHQVKVRGFRIELGEIEAALADQPAVREAAVVARERQGEMGLVAYVVPAGGEAAGLAQGSHPGLPNDALRARQNDEAPASGARRAELGSPGCQPGAIGLAAEEAAGLRETLRAALAVRLPDYMVPAVFVFLPALPLSPAGKLDRKALPDPETVFAEQAQAAEPVAPRTPLEAWLVDLWREVLGIDRLGIQDSFFERGGTSIGGAVAINRLQAELGEIIHVVVLFDHPTPAAMAGYLGCEHGAAVARRWGQESLPADGTVERRDGRIGLAEVAAFRSLVSQLPLDSRDEPRNPRAVFVLSPPRSGSTLLRVMLGGHPGLFAPPELELLSFDTLAERREAFSGRDAFWLEGVIRALMEVRGCGPEEAREIVAACEAEGWTTRRFYGELQSWLDGRVLVDKTPSYALDPGVLRRAEEAFAEPFYIHLIRHPYGMIRSFEEARLDQLFFRRPHPFSRRGLAELIWLASHQNVTEHLAGVPAERQHWVRFEDLVADPEGEMRRLCAALGIDYHPDMADPYREKRARMTDGIYAEGRMLGDVKFHQHQGVEAEAAERWRQEYAEDFLGEPAWEMAASLGYERPGQARLASIERTPRETGEPAPLSFAQERLWFLDRLEPGSPVYNLPREYRLRGSLDTAALAGALGEVVRRHEVLRTVYQEQDGVPVQVVLPWGGPSGSFLPRVDLAALPVPARRTEAARIASEEARRPFDLSRGPLLRSLLIRLGAEEHTLLLNLHHIATDGWSMGVVRRELAALYRRFKSGGPSPLPPLPVQYADFAVWQRRALAEALAPQLELWRRQLAGLPPSLDLPADRPRPAMQSLAGAVAERLLAPSLAAGLEAVGRRQGATLFMTLLCGFQVLLHRLTAQEDLAVGVPTANRGRAEIEDLVGFFVNTLVLRADLSGDPSFSEALGRVRRTALDAYAAADLPFEKLVAELAPERDLSRTPLFQVLFALQDAPAVLDLGDGLTAEVVPVPTGTAKFDLSLFINRGPRGLELTAEYATALFDASTVARLLSGLQTLLEGIAADSGARLSDLPLLGPAERAQLVAWNDEARRGYPEGALLHELFEEQARRTPEALAVVAAGGVRLTYAELERRSAGLAERLRGMGVGPEVPVGVCLPRSADLVIALLAVLRAGGFYVPIDPTYPAERIAFLLEDSGCAVVLSDTEETPHGASLQWEARTEPGNLAYLIYTSGSTGRPKGVAIEHRSAVVMVQWARAVFSPAELAGVIASTSITFDLSVFEIFVPLACGGTVFVVDNALAVPGFFAAEGMEPTLINTVPSAIAELLRSDGLPETVRTINLAGEALLRALADAVYARPATERLYNLYGPSEDTTYSTWALIERSGERTPAIGRPVHDTRAHVLDPRGNPLPVGVPGELYLAGRGLARGYFRRPELTAERFVPDPEGEGARMYRTGDRVRLRPDGELDYLGRLDHQVKVRGFRIELGEVEAALARHPAVQQAVVLARDGRLAAYVVLSENVSPDLLRDGLAVSLPEHMVPALWVVLEALPLTPNGKVDRKALAAMEVSAQLGDSGTAAPRNPVEELLSTLFAELLGLDREPGMGESFFRLGGHSLLAFQLVSRVRAAFGIDLTVRDVLEQPTVAGLARRIAQAAHAGRPAVPPLVPVERGNAAPLSFAQQRLWFFDRFESNSAAYNLPVLFSIHGEGLRPGTLSAALGEVVRRHEALRVVFREGEGGEPRQEIRPSSPGAALSLVDLSGLPASAAEASRREVDVAEMPFDLAWGPLLRSVLFRLGAAEHRLLISMHHIAADGWSVGVLARELSAAYRGAALPELPVQYADYAVWQRRWLAGEALEAELAWWRERLAGIPPALALPVDRPRPAVQSYRGGHRRITVDSAALAALGRRSGATFFMTALAACATFLHRLTAEEDLVVGAPVANRDRVEVEGLIGFFVNMLALRTSLAGDPTGEELLARVRTAALDAYAHQELPFERLVAELAPERDLSHHPVFQVALVVEEAPPALDLGPGLSTSPGEVRTRTAKFDLLLHLSREGAGIVFAADLFDPPTIDRFLGHLRTLLAGIASSPSVRVSDLPLLTPSELEQLRAAWDGGEAAPLPASTLHGLVERQVRLTPGALAIDADHDLRLTYAELWARVEALALTLRGLGVGLETRVALCAGRSTEHVVGLLGILAAGGACVPLDPGHLSDRLAFVLEDSGAAVLATTAELAPRLPEGLPRVLLDEGPHPLAPSPVSLPPPAGRGGTQESLRDRTDRSDRSDREVFPDNLAYVIYTSGSTGRPKGVAMPHVEAAGHCVTLIRDYGLGVGDRVPQLASPAFDVSLEEILPTLACGATLVLRGGNLWETGEVARRMGELGLTVVNQPPVVWQQIVQDAESLDAPPASLRLMMVGGEEVLAEPARQWLRTPLAAVPLLNGYGPTETAITATIHRVSADTIGTDASVPIGRPLPGRAGRVLDPRGNPLPAGVSGELYLSGHLARGYLGRPDLTAERFVPDPFAAEPGARMYRTGDRVRLRADGALVFLGRIDQQVKVRGFRVEPAEIEAALLAHPGVVAAAVLVREDGGEKRLVAFVEPVGEAPSAADLRAFLKRRLPPWLVPAGFVTVPKLPLRSSGKVDREALARLAVETRGGGSEPPRTEVEQALAAIWEQVLKVERVGRTDDFFHLGGHSLTAVRLLSRVKRQLGVVLELSDLLAAPVLAQLAARIEQEQSQAPAVEPEMEIPVSAGSLRTAPAAFAQRRLWFLDRLQPGQATYNLPDLLRFEGPLRPAVLEAALTEIVRRHAALRTTFAVEDDSGEPMQVISEPAPHPLPLVDLSALPAGQAAMEADLRIQAELRRPFDLERGPILRSLLIRLAPEEHQLALTVHHIVSDGWSAQLLVRELQALYVAFSEGLPSPLPELPLQYTDYAVRQRRWLEGEEAAAQLGWWRQRLAGGAPDLELAADRPRPPAGGLRGGCEELELSRSLSEAVEAIGLRQGATLFMTLLAAWAALLHRSTGEEDLWIGTPVANRELPEVEGLIGLFTNALVLRTGLEGGTTFAALVERARETTLAALAHQEIPFERLIEELVPERDASRPPFFQVTFSLRADAPARLALGPGLFLQQQTVWTGTVKIDLSLLFLRTADGRLAARAEYGADLFGPAAVRRMLGHLRNLLEGAAAEGGEGTCISDLPLLSAAERGQVLAAGNATEAEIPEAPVHALFLEHARTAPDAMAVAWDGGVLTRGELARRAGCLARRLRGLGAGPEALVAVLLERSPELPLAALAALLAGGAYLPIDPSYPAERVLYMLRDSGACALLTSTSIAAGLPGIPLPEDRILRLDRWTGEDEGGEVEITARPDGLAYMIYTSGSTGVPKGAALCHGGMSNLLSWERRTLGMVSADHAALVAGPGFDASVWETWSALSAGAALHIPLRDTVLSPRALFDWLAEHGITLTFLPTPLAEALLAETVPQGLALRVLKTGGDRLRRRPAPDLPFRLLNVYGPTECTVLTTVSWVAAVGERAPDIGLPIANMRVHLLDRSLGLLPEGLKGELCIAGDGLARGYHGRPGLTAERFVPDPFGPPGSRLYRTGDLARRTPDGVIECLGRTDHQVKIRGFRIELGEIEAWLIQHPAVREAVVLARPAEGRLAACVVPEDGPQQSPPSPRDLQEHLAARLPEHMVPTAWAFLPALPLTPNGKLDRRALERMPTTATDPKPAATVAPRTEVEERLAGLFAEVLELERPVGVDESFFHLGGHSLLVIRLVWRLRELVGGEVGPRLLFENPTVAELAAWIEAAHPGSAGVPPALHGAVEETEQIPLSFAQQRLWFLDRLQPGSPAYNIPVILPFEGPLHAGLLAAALGEIVRRHAALRTTFAVPPGSSDPVQVVHPPALWHLPLIDLAALPAAQREAEAARLAEADARQPFDLETGPLLRTRLCRLASHEHQLLVCLHHIVADGWSVDVLRRELAALYRAFGQGQPSPLPELPVQYPGFAVWQRNWLAGAELERQLAFWRERLADPPVLELPSDRPRPAVWSYRGASERTVLPASLAAGIERLGQPHRATPFMTLLAGFLTLLHRFTAQEDLVVGSPVAGRDRGELEGLIGFFVNTLALRVSLEGDPAFPELLGRVRETALAAFAHQEVPFEKLVAELAPGRDLSRTPLYQVIFSLQSVPAPVEIENGLVLASGDGGAHSGTAKFDLSLHTGLSPEGLMLWVEYGTDLFDRATVQRLIGCFHRVLEGVVADPAARVSELPLLGEAEREQVVHGWNRTAAEVPEQPVHRLFEERATLVPEALAVAGPDASLSYGELEQRANRLAHRLRRLGVGPESVAALLLERSPDLAVAALAVLKAGGAYLPIDPAQPAERVLHVLRDARAAVLLGATATLGSLPELPLPVLDLEAESFADESGEPPAVEVDPEGLAYVIYTSGSTGVPKGVELRHRGLSSLAAWHRRTCELGAADRSALLAGPGFDASVWELWPALTAGASLHVPPRDTVLSPVDLLAWMAGHRITVTFLPTPLAEAVLGEPIPEGLKLRALLTGGDRLVRRPSPGLPFALVNHYGPTESTVVATAGRVAPEGERTPDIGLPIANTRVHLLDRNLSPVPVGVPGELCIAGEGLARGYRNRPEMTAERFVPDPFKDSKDTKDGKDSKDGGRMYRTGDLARRLPGGEIEFLGRRDQQVKIRGVRIELGEIEASLGRHAGVREAAVLVRAQDQRLVACVTLREGGPAPEELRAFLAERLPGPMIPSVWVFLEGLPVNASGKVDRGALARALPAPEAMETGTVAPSTHVERELAEIWVSLLGLRTVGVTDDFFALGGHSLLAARLTMRVRNRFGVELPLRLVFEQPTIAGLASWIEGAGMEVAAPPLMAGLAGELPPLSFSQQRLWFLDRLQPGSPAYNIPVFLRLDGPLRIGPLAAALDEIVRRHAALRTTFAVPPGSSDPVQVIHPPAPWLLPVVDLAALPAAERAAEAGRLAREEARRPFDLQAGPLLRTRLDRLGMGEHRLMVSLHHIVADGWSVDVLQNEIAALYGAFAQGKPSPLPELPVQYPDFAVWQRAWLAGGELERQLAFWRERLASPPVLELPADRPRPAVWSYRGASEAAELPAALAADLERLGQRHRATPFMTLLAAFLVLLHRYTAQEDLVVGTPVAGRDRGELEGLIGFFVNTLALRVDLAGDPPFPELLARVREAALSAFAHQDLPFEKLVEELAPGRDLSRSPLFQVVFSLQGVPAPVESAGGLAVASAEGVHHGTSKFDLSFNAGLPGGGPGGLWLWVEYGTDLFDRATVQRLTGHFHRLLEGVAADPAARVSELPLLGEAEREQVVHGWNRTAAEVPEQPVHRLVEERAALDPEALAVAGLEESLTYGELERRANCLAHRLRRLGIGPESVAALLLERSPDLAVAALAVLKAGGAYLPIDPAYPAERVLYVLRDAGAAVLLGASAALRSLPELPLRVLDLEMESFVGESERPLHVEVDPEGLAYVIYTSGSTGMPKGVELRHRGLSSLAAWHRRTYVLGAADRSALLAGPGFDASVWELWPALTAGASLHVPPRETVLSPPALLSWLAGHRITATFLPTPLAEAVLAEPVRDGLVLRALLTGGDRLVRRPSADLPFVLVNHYGPTESTVVTTAGRVAPEGERAPDIGQPIANTRVHLLDGTSSPVPLGVPGELCIAGEGLARGYRNRPEMTAERFVPDPFTDGGRLYRTGDLARRLPGGEIEFLGRRDQQVKIRGFRIELGEIEAALGACPGIEAAVAAVREDRLVAYLVPANGLLDPDGLSAILAERLPGYMVPAAYVVLEALPLTPHGKVDRSALPAPEKRPDDTDFVAPRTSLERDVAEVWREVLGTERVGVHDSFWKLGGHSLLATRILARLEGQFGVGVPLQSLFTAPTLGAFASAFGQAVLAAQGPELGDAISELGALSDEEVQQLLATETL